MEVKDPPFIGWCFEIIGKRGRYYVFLVEFLCDLQAISSEKVLSTLFRSLNFTYLPSLDLFLLTLQFLCNS